MLSHAQPRMLTALLVSHLHFTAIRPFAPPAYRYYGTSHAFKCKMHAVAPAPSPQPHYRTTESHSHSIRLQAVLV